MVVDDGVPIGFQSELSRVVAEASGSLVVSGYRQGKGSAIAAGIERLLAAQAPKGLLIMDSDGQHPPAAIPRFVAAAGRSELVIGDRLGDLRRMPLARQLSNLAAARLLAARTRGEVRDSQCGMRLLRGRALTDVPFPHGGFEAESEHLKQCLLAGIAVEWIPIPAIYDGEESSFRTLRDGVRVAWELVR